MNFEDEKYIISTDGRIYIKSKNRFAKPTIFTHGYYMVGFHGKVQLLHRIVAKKLIPNPNNYPFVNHKNGVKTDNRVENLEWCTSSQNQYHAYNTGLKVGAQTGRSGNKHHLSRPIISIQDTAIIEHESGNLCAKYFNASAGNIQTAIKKGYNYKGHKLYYL